jgi:hypothetical protein
MISHEILILASDCDIIVFPYEMTSLIFNMIYV